MERLGIRQNAVKIEQNRVPGQFSTCFGLLCCGGEILAMMLPARGFGGYSQMVGIFNLSHTI